MAKRRLCISPPARAIIRPTVGSSTSAPPKKSLAACGRLGIGKGDTVALHSETRAEFYLADLGVLANGSIAAALYTTIRSPIKPGTCEPATPRPCSSKIRKSMQALLAAGSDQRSRSCIGFC